MKLVFWICLALSGYVYVIYPFLMSVLSRLMGRRFKKSDTEPPITVIITAYNEEQHIARKIENTLSLDYPQDKVEIIVGSDGSNDRTNEIVGSYQDRGVRLLAFPENRGKTMVQNDCVRVAAHGIIVFMDAASLCKDDCLRKLVSNFTDSRVGAVAGRIVFTQSRENLTTESQGIYWRYEQLIKTAESSIGSLIGVDGPLYAIRKSLYTVLDADMMSDFVTPLLVIRDGHCVVYEPDAVTYEEATTQAGDEFRTRKRIVTRGFTALARYPELLDITTRPFLAWQIISHKVLRWLVGFFYAGMTVSSFLLMAECLYAVAFGGLAILMALAYRGLKIQDHPRKYFAVPYYFMLVNLAAMKGTLDFLRGKRVISWKPVRD